MTAQRLLELPLARADGRSLLSESGEVLVAFVNPHYVVSVVPRPSPPGMLGHRDACALTLTSGERLDVAGRAFDVVSSMHVWLMREAEGGKQ